MVPSKSWPCEVVVSQNTVSFSANKSCHFPDALLSLEQECTELNKSPGGMNKPQATNNNESD